MGRTYRHNNKYGEDSKYKKEKYLQEQKNRFKRRVEEDTPNRREEKQERRGRDD